MNIQNKAFLHFRNLSHAYDDKVLFDSISGSIVASDRIGLIGINGSGKSSLLKILAGLIEPNSGSVNNAGTIEYVAQIDLDLYRKEIPLYKYIETSYDEWWQVLTEYERLFGQTLQEDRMINTLSGGEVVKLNIVMALVKKPDILLLDEPTNHLDLKSLEELEDLLSNIGIPFILVSHNVNFLNKLIRTIWAIDSQKLQVYGGNFDFYSEQKGLIQEAKSRQYEEKKKEIKKLERVKAQEQKRAQRAKKVGIDISKKHDRGTDRFATGFFKNSSENSGARKIALLESKENELTDRMQQLKISSRKKIYLDLQSEQKSGLVISIANGKLLLPSKLLLLDDVNLNVYHQDRIAILGDNGSGKTTFIKQLAFNKNHLLQGEIKYGAEYKTLYVDQKYDLVNPEQTITENIQTANPAISYENIRKVLGNMNFSSDLDINKTAKNLSGGETARLAFAIATNSNVDVLILDEPTNNLDIETIDVVAYALMNFKGTLIVISHDIHFLNSISISTFLEIKNKCLSNYKKSTN